MRALPKLLSAGGAGGTLFSRNEILRQASYAVVAATSVEEALAALDREPFDLVIVGQLFAMQEKNLIANKAKSCDRKVLCLYADGHQPDVSAADVFIHNLDGRERLLAAVAALIGKSAWT